MLSAQYRLRNKRDFDRVYKGGKTIRTALFRISTAPNQLPDSRFGIVVSNAVVKKAVARNRKKRQIREGVASIVREVTSGYDIIIAAQPSCAQSSYAEIEAHLRTAFKKIGFITS